MNAVLINDERNISSVMFADSRQEFTDAPDPSGRLPWDPRHLAGVGVNVEIPGHLKGKTTNELEDVRYLSLFSCCNILVSVSVFWIESVWTIIPIGDPSPL